MGVFNPKNLISPFSNTVNLVAIILIILLFAVFRFSLGRYSTEPLPGRPKAVLPAAVSPSLNSVDALIDKKAAEPVVPAPVKEVKEPVKVEAPKNLAPTVQTERHSRGAALENEIHALTGAKEKEQQKAAEAKKKQEEASLDEVEKALGLR